MSEVGSYKPEGVDCIDDEDGIERSTEVDIKVEEGESKRTALHHISQPLLLDRLPLPSRQEV